jgi:hypothetical protein
MNMIKQEIFNKVWNHFVTEGKPLSVYLATSGHLECCYRQETPEGTLKCAVGLLLPDELYDPEFEGGNVCSLLRNAKAIGETLTLAVNEPDGVDFLTSLQCAHDNTALSKGVSIEDELRKVASFYALTIP